MWLLFTGLLISAYFTLCPSFNLTDNGEVSSGLKPLLQLMLTSPWKSEAPAELSIWL